MFLHIFNYFYFCGMRFPVPEKSAEVVYFENFPVSPSPHFKLTDYQFNCFYHLLQSAMPKQRVTVGVLTIKI